MDKFDTSSDKNTQGLCEKRKAALTALDRFCFTEKGESWNRYHLTRAEVETIREALTKEI